MAGNSEAQAYAWASELSYRAAIRAGRATGGLFRLFLPTHRHGYREPGGGGGTTANTLPPARRSGVAGDPTGGNKSFAVGDTDTVYAPFTAGQGRVETVTGQQGQQGETSTREGKSPLPGTNNPALVPYDQVFQKYSEIAGQTMERSYIPSGLKDYVKEYFSGLEP